MKKEGDDSADFISCIVFGKPAEFVETYFRKGMRVTISGRIQTGSYTNKEGVKVYTTEVVIEEQEFAQSKSEGREREGVHGSDGFANIPDGMDSELPFH